LKIQRTNRSETNMIITDKKILACVDQSDHTDSVALAAMWAAQQLRTPVELLHVLDRHLETAHSDDRSGTLGVDAQDILMANLSNEDASRSKMAREQGRLFLSRLRQNALDAGLTGIDIRQRHGTVAGTLADLAPNASLVIMGRRGERTASTAPNKDISRSVADIIRTLPCPVMLTPAAFVPPTKVLLAFDGRSATRDAVRAVASSGLLKGLPIHVTMSGKPISKPTNDSHKQLDWAQALLADAGFEVSSTYVPGQAAQVIAQQVNEHNADLLILGVGTHSPLHQLLFGSKTVDILRAVDIPALIIR
jgi:nucleotide-binding universal stress UspA family protein